METAIGIRNFQKVSKTLAIFDKKERATYTSLAIQGNFHRCLKNFTLPFAQIRIKSGQFSF